MLGRTVLNRTVVNQKIDISSLPKGLYIISVVSEGQEKAITILKE